MGAFGAIAELLSLLLCVGAVVTNTLLLLSCDLWKVESLLFEEGSLGLFSWQVPSAQPDQGCTDIATSDDRDYYEGQILLCARWSAVAALSLGGIMLLLLFFQQYLVPLPCTLLLRDVCAIGTQIGLGLVYSTYFSKLCTDFACHYGPGTLLLIVTQSLWAGGGVVSLCMRPGRYARSQAAAAKKQGSQQQQQAAENEEQQEEARDTFTNNDNKNNNSKENTLEAGLAKYENDGTMSETSSLAVGMSMNPDDDKSDGRLEQSTGLAKQQEGEES